MLLALHTRPSHRDAVMVLIMPGALVSCRLLSVSVGDSCTVERHTLESVVIGLVTRLL
jgi:hypothetical protein